MLKNLKSETRSTKQARMTKIQNKKSGIHPIEPNQQTGFLNVSVIGSFSISNFFRISIFRFRISKCNVLIRLD